MRLLALDIATSTGWALMDTDRAPSAIISGSLKFRGDTAFEKVTDLRRKLPKLIREHRPDFCILEAPLSIIPTFEKRKKTMLGDQEVVTETVNPGTVMQLNRLHGAAQLCALGQNIECIEVRPQTWQTIIDRDIRGKTKERAKLMCERLKIDASNADARDACLIAYWASRKCDVIRLRVANVRVMA